MKLHLSAALAMPAALAQILSPCYYGSELCTCDPGTTFAVSHTTMVVGSNARDFYDVTGDFFGISWEFLNTTSTTGRDNFPGATRNTTVPVGSIQYKVTEKLTRHLVQREGRFFFMQFEQANYPVEFEDGSGEFAGYWVTFESAAVGPCETYVSWKINSCFTGDPFNFTEFKEGSLQNAAAILKNKGKLTGTTIPPITTQNQ